MSDELTSDDKWQIDEIIMRWWDAKDDNAKKKVELECYKELKSLNFNPEMISYLHENDADELASEMEHFMNLYQKVSHDHEKRRVA